MDSKGFGKKRSGHDRGNIPEFSWRIRSIPRTTSSMMAVLKPRYEQGTYRMRLERYRYFNLVGLIYRVVCGVFCR